jgi:hypothetical protein
MIINKHYEKIKNLSKYYSYQGTFQTFCFLGNCIAQENKNISIRCRVVYTLIHSSRSYDGK